MINYEYFLERICGKVEYFFISVLLGGNNVWLLVFLMWLFIYGGLVFMGSDLVIGIDNDWVVIGFYEFIILCVVIYCYLL